MHFILEHFNEGNETQMQVRYMGMSKDEVREQIVADFADGNFPDDVVIETADKTGFEPVTVDSIDEVLMEGFYVELRSEEWDYVLHLQYDNKEHNHG